MVSAFITELSDRALLTVSGAEAQHFLQGLVTCDIDAVTASAPAYGALLTPQGKILFDFLVYGSGDGYLLDVDAGSAPALAKRLAMYKLRARVEVAPAAADRCAVALWGALDTVQLPEGAVDDPRLKALGKRVVLARSDIDALAAASGLEKAGLAAWHANRIALGVPQSGRDFELGQAFPHDADMDALNGVAFAKGCYVGQEVVSRMKHRGTARRRIVQVAAEAALPTPGTEITAGGKTVGTLGSTDGSAGLAEVRLDRAAEAIAAGEPILAGDTPLTLKIPDWATFTWPQPSAAEEGAPS